MKKKTVLCLMLIIILFLTLSCRSKDVEKEDIDIGEIEHPDMIFENVNYTIGETGILPIYIKAKSIKIYQEKKLTILEGISFTQEDDDNNIVMTGSCDEARIENESYNATLIGEVILNRPIDKLTIKSENLDFDYQKQLIETDKDVILKYNEGNEINGTGLTGDFLNSIYEFDRINKGTIMQ
ncbi:MAG: LPS export ABC transporter periplasmic protein LptC [Sphaerochaetaceae bacterium]|nr:LPS export ABC transporter periplasmic protein LptC [Sphaerochaetaceae bacterium]